jgi:deoxyribodipyrimidine photo-lyase
VRFERMSWSRSRNSLRAWQCGLTGYPLVDAGMRELWHTGWMHNRVRMIVASFLIKNLRHHWREGARWFWDTLVDADLANNTMGWQWTAGCGADAAPYYRVFNPTLQAQRYDPQLRYIRQWIPELARLPDRWLREPWMANPEVLTGAGVVLGKTYPRPIVDLKLSRDRALAGYRRLRQLDSSAT